MMGDGKMSLLGELKVLLKLLKELNCGVAVVFCR